MGCVHITLFELRAFTHSQTHFASSRGATCSSEAVNHSHTCPHSLMQDRHAAQEHINMRFAGVNQGLKPRPPAQQKARPQPSRCVGAPIQMYNFKNVQTNDPAWSLIMSDLKIRWTLHVWNQRLAPKTAQLTARFLPWLPTLKPFAGSNIMFSDFSPRVVSCVSYTFTFRRPLGRFPGCRANNLHSSAIKQTRVKRFLRTSGGGLAD